MIPTWFSGAAYLSANPDVAAFSPIGGIFIAGGAILLGIGTVQDGDNIHIATQDDNDVILYHVWSMASDSFTTSNEAVTSAVGTDIDTDKAIDIEIETGGDPILFYQGASANSMGQKERVDRAWKTGGSWTVDQAVDDGGAIHYFLGGIVRGEADKFHLTYKDDTGPIGQHKSVQDVDGTLSAVETFGNTATTNAEDFIVLPPTYVDRSGDEYIDFGLTRTNVSPSSVQALAAFVVINDGVPTGNGLMWQFGNVVGEFLAAVLAVDQGVEDVWALNQNVGLEMNSALNALGGG